MVTLRGYNNIIIVIRRSKGIGVQWWMAEPRLVSKFCRHQLQRLGLCKQRSGLQEGSSWMCVDSFYELTKSSALWVNSPKGQSYPWVMSHLTMRLSIHLLNSFIFLSLPPPLVFLFFSSLVLFLYFFSFFFISPPSCSSLSSSYLFSSKHPILIQRKDNCCVQYAI